MNTKKSEKLFKEAQKILVGGVNSPVRSFKAVGGNPLFIKGGKGPYLISEDGDTYIDYVLSWGPLLFGHSHPDILKAIQEALPHGTSFGAPCAQEIQLAELIQHFFPSCEKIRLVNSGTEATMSAIRLARGYTDRKKIIKFNGCYHGHVDSLLVQAGSGALTFGKPDSKGVLPEMTEHTLLCEYNDIENVKNAFDKNPDQIAAIIVEPVPGNMGLVLPSTNFLQELRNLCTKHKAVLIFDEVMTGFRVHPGGAQAIYKIRPDLTCLGKVIGGGLPCGAFGGRKEIMDYLSPLGPVYQAGTLSGNPLSAVAGIAMLTLLKNKPEGFKHAENMTKLLTEQFSTILEKNSVPHQINQLGTMFTLFFTGQPVKNLQDAKTSNLTMFNFFFSEMLKRGHYFAPSQFESNFLSSVHTESNVEKTVSSLKEIVNLPIFKEQSKVGV